MRRAAGAGVAVCPARVRAAQRNGRMGLCCGTQQGLGLTGRQAPPPAQRLNLNLRGQVPCPLAGAAQLLLLFTPSKLPGVLPQCLMCSRHSPCVTCWYVATDAFEFLYFRILPEF